MTGKGNVHDAVIPDADAPEILIPTQFAAAGWSWMAVRPSIFGSSRAIRLSLRFSSSLRADGLISMAYLDTQPPALGQIGFDGF